MPAHHLQPALDALDDEFHRLVLEHLEATKTYHRRREALVQEMASGVSLVEDMPHDITQEAMVEDGETS